MPVPRNNNWRDDFHGQVLLPHRRNCNIRLFNWSSPSGQPESSLSKGWQVVVGGAHLYSSSEQLGNILAAQTNQWHTRTHTFSFSRSFSLNRSIIVGNYLHLIQKSMSKVVSPFFGFHPPTPPSRWKLPTINFIFMIISRIIHQPSFRCLRIDIQRIYICNGTSKYR